MLKEYFLKKMLERNLSQVPQSERDRLVGMISQNPDFFAKLASSIQSKMTAGKEQMSAVREVMEENRAELSQLFKADTHS